MKMLSIISTLSTLGSAFILTLGSCGQGGGTSGTQTTDRAGQAAQQEQIPIAYDLQHPTVYTMPDELREVSGISFYKGDPAMLYAEQDENGRLYWLEPGGDKAHYYDFGKDGDYEDLAFVGSQVVFLKSNGNLYSFDFKPAAGADAAPVTGKLQEWKDLLPKGEYEGLYADTGQNQLYVLCKECKNEDHKKAVSVYKLKSNGQGWALSGSSTVDVTKISALSANEKDSGKKNKKIDFKPSAISLNPLTHQWYLLSSVNKMLVVTDAGFQVQAVYPLDHKQFPQPEGMCFDRDNNLYISNEGPAGGEGTVLKFTYKGN